MAVSKPIKQQFPFINTMDAAVSRLKRAPLVLIPFRNTDSCIMLSIFLFIVLSDLDQLYKNFHSKAKMWPLWTLNLRFWPIWKDARFVS